MWNCWIHRLQKSLSYCDKRFKIIDTNVGHTYYQYTINGSVDLEAQEFFPRWEEFAKKSKLFQCDVSLEMRWFD